MARKRTKTILKDLENIFEVDAILTWAIRPNPGPVIPVQRRSACWQPNGRYQVVLHCNVDLFTGTVLDFTFSVLF